MVDEDKKLQADEGVRRTRARVRRRGLTAEQHGVEGAENTARAANYGYNETDKAVARAARVDRGRGPRGSGVGSARWRARPSHEELTGRLAKDNALAYEHTLDLARRRADVEAEIHQLAIDQNREFSRSFFGAGAADMLRKLAAFKLALGGGVTQGQLYSMGPAMRQDVGSLTGMNPEMTRLLLERNKLRRIGFAGGGYTGDGNPKEIAGVVHKGEYVLNQRGFRGRRAWRRPARASSAGRAVDSGRGKDRFRPMRFCKTGRPEPDRRTVCRELIQHVRTTAWLRNRGDNGLAGRGLHAATSGIG